MKYALQIKGLARREIARFLKVPYQTLGAPIVTSALYLLIFGIGVGKYLKAPFPISYLQFIIPGLIAMNMIRASYENITSSIVSSKYVHELQDLRVAPLTTMQILLGYIAASMTRAIFVGFITYLIGNLFSYFYLKQFVYVQHPFELIFFTIFGTATFSCIGIIVAMGSKSFEQISVFGSFILVPLTYLGGVFFSLDMLSPIWQKIALFNPIYYLIEGTRYAFLNRDTTSLIFEMTFLFCFTTLCFIFGQLSLRKGSQYA